MTIHHGDSAELVPALGAFDLVLTDPPYAPSGSRNEWKVTASVAIGLNAAARAVRPGGAMLVFSASSGRGVDFVLGAVSPVLRFNRVLTWHKEFVRSRVAGPWRWDTVLVLCFGRASFGRPEFSSVFTSKGPCSRNHIGAARHPAELPDGIADWLYTPFDADGIRVLDPFCGSAQLLRPAAAAGREVVGVDVNAEWCDLACTNLDSDALARRRGEGVTPSALSRDALDGPQDLAREAARRLTGG